VDVGRPKATEALPSSALPTEGDYLMTKETALEAVTSNVATKTAANAVAVLGATITPLAAFVPFLVDALAAGRQGKRLEAMFEELNQVLRSHSEQLQQLSDDQYKILNESISAAFYTIDERKLALLRNAATNIFTERDAITNVADTLSRIIRDISAAEAAFVSKNFGYELIVISEETLESPDSPRTLSIRPNSEEEIVLSGLINLGLLYAKSSRYDVIGFEWSPLVVKLLRLLRDA